MAIDPTPQGIFQAHVHQSTETPWSSDPTPQDMAYVAVCPACNGVSFLCTTTAASDATCDHARTITICLKRGHALHRVSCVLMQQRGTWHFCHCHVKAVPHAS